MTSAKGVDLSKALFKGKVGLSVMLTDNPGEVQTTSESMRDINRFKKTKRINALKIHISNEKCLMLKDWHEDYATREEIIYGGIDKRPLLGEGSGCSAFAMSFLEYANIDFDLFNREFLRTVYLPHDLMGGEQGDYKRIRVKHVLRSRISLKEETENSKRVDFYDPTYIYHWIANEWNAKNQEEETYLGSFYDLETKLDRKMKVLVLREKE